jgi:hypothetical protein
MRLVEVVMLMGAHCVSPVEHSQMLTEAAKVQCAVVIEKDTDRGTMTVTPPAAASDPQVMAAISRFQAAPADTLTGSGTRIVPAWAPAGSPTVEIKPPVAVPAPIAPRAEAGVQEAKPAAEAAPQQTSTAASTKQASAPERKVATLAPAPQTRQPAKTPAARKQPAKSVAAAPAVKTGAQCKGVAVARWYKTADGKRKYRCVKPASDSAPEQLY